MSKRKKNQSEEVDKINVKEKLNHNVLDLSLMNISVIPVDEIKTLKRATILDLSNNVISIISTDFTSLIQLTKLDLSKNKIKSISDDFGNLVNLRHLDLYNNQIERLPLSFGRLKKLKYLDMKNNPLNPVFSKVIGTCTDQKDCIEAARKAVAFMVEIEQQVIEDRRKEREQKDIIVPKEQTESASTVIEKSKPDKRKKPKTKKASTVNNTTEALDAEKMTESNHVPTAETSFKGKNASSNNTSKVIKYFLLFAISTLIFLGFFVLLKPDIANIIFDANDMEILEEFIK